ncbi:MAG: response regulator [Gemmatimonadota bacterium]
MSPEREADGPAGQPVEPEQASASDRVLLEVSILESESEDAQRPNGVGDEPDEEDQGRTVLVISNDEDMRRYVRRCLRTHDGIQVVEAPDGKDAFAEDQKVLPSLVIVDVVEPGSTYPLDRALRSRSVPPQLPTIVITDEPPVGGRQLPPGAATYVLVKPFNARRLCAEVDRMIDH